MLRIKFIKTEKIVYPLDNDEIIKETEDNIKKYKNSEMISFEETIEFGEHITIKDMSSSMTFEERIKVLLILVYSLYLALSVGVYDFSFLTKDNILIKKISSIKISDETPSPVSSSSSSSLTPSPSSSSSSSRYTPSSSPSSSSLTPSPSSSSSSSRYTPSPSSSSSLSSHLQTLVERTTKINLINEKGEPVTETLKSKYVPVITDLSKAKIRNGKGESKDKNKILISDIKNVCAIFGVVIDIDLKYTSSKYIQNIIYKLFIMTQPASITHNF
jgi:hypothetical protein